MVSLFRLPQVSVDRLYQRKEAIEILESYLEKTYYKEVYVDLVSDSPLDPGRHLSLDFS